MSHTENTSKTRKSVYQLARMLSKVGDNGKRKLQSIFNKHSDKWIIYIWNALSKHCMQMLVKMTSYKKKPNKQNMSYHSVFIIIKSTILSCMSHFEQEKGNKHVMQHRNTHSGLFLLKRERNKHHSDQWKRNHTWKQEDGLSIQHRLSHVTEEKQKLMWTPDKTAVSNKNLKPAPTHFCSVQNLNCISIIWIKVAD